MLCETDSATDKLVDASVSALIDSWIAILCETDSATDKLVDASISALIDS